MVATWSDSDESNFEEEDSYKQANLCLMAHENEVNAETPNDFTFEELQEIFYDLVDDLKKLGVKNKELKSKNQFLLKKNENISNEKSIMSQENLNLKIEIAKLKLMVEKFTLSSNKLHMILDNQKVIYNKAGLGYNPLKK